MKFKWSKTIAAILLAILIFIPMWIKYDIYEETTATYSPMTIEKIDSLEITPILIPNISKKEPSTFFKFNLVWEGPYQFRVSFRDFSHKFKKVKLDSVMLKSNGNAWTQQLYIPDEFNGWREIEKMSWTDEYNETWFFATIQDNSKNWSVGKIQPPKVDGPIVVNMVFELEDSGNIVTYEKSYKIVCDPTKKYNSYIIAKIGSA